MSESDFDYLPGQISDLLHRVNALEEELAKTKRLMPFAVGNWVRVNFSDVAFYRAGDIGCVHEVDDDGDLWIDFSKHQGDRCFMAGIWCVSKDRLTRLETTNV